MRATTPKPLTLASAADLYQLLAYKLLNNAAFSVHYKKRVHQLTAALPIIRLFYPTALRETRSSLL
jgi:hypothetical protein